MSESAAMRNWDSSGHDARWLRGDPMQLSGILHDPHWPTHACIYLDSTAAMPKVSGRLDGEGLGDGPLLPVAANSISIGR